MQVTITVADKLIKNALRNTLDNCVYEYFDTATVKAAKVPKIADAVKTIFEDAKFQAKLAKMVAGLCERDLEDFIYDEMYDLELPGVKAMVQACEEADELCRAEQDAKREAEEVARMIKTLERAGYKLIKA